MSNELQLKGARPSNPTRFAPVFSARFYNGIITQRNPFIDNGSHIESEFYGKRIDCLIDGLNSEVSPKLTYIRRPGSSTYNSQTFPAINRYYENRTVTYNGAQTVASESIQVVADTASVVYDATGPSTKTALFNKTAGAGSTYFQSVGNSLYLSDGPDQKKYLTPSKIWAANQTFSLGDWILDTNGNVQVAETAFTLNVESVFVTQVSSVWYVVVQFESEVPWTTGTAVKFEGLTGYTVINGTSPVTVSLPDLNPNQAAFAATTSAYYGPVADSGTGTSQPTATQYESGSSTPTWNAALGGTTDDGNIQWQNFGKQIYNWASPAPVSAPILSSAIGVRYWQSGQSFLNLSGSNFYQSIIDSNGNVEFFILAPSGSAQSGPTPPVWSQQVPSSTSVSGLTADGTVTWTNGGPLLGRQPSTQYYANQCVLDANRNIQYVSTAGTTGSSATVSWNTAVGGTTTDGTVTWTNIGSGSILLTEQQQYGYSLHSVDGSVTTSSPVTSENLASYVIGPYGTYAFSLQGSGTVDSQIDKIWVWRTVQGGSQLLFLDSIPNPSIGSVGTWNYYDYYPDSFLNSEIEAPIAKVNDPPPVGITALAYHLIRVWAALGNLVYYSTGPDVTAGNGNTAWNPSNVFVMPSSVTRFWPTTYGIVVFTTSDVYVIQGLGTASSPFFVSQLYQGIGLVSYDAFTLNGSIAFLYTTDNEVVTFDPSSGVSEVGFPISDQFGPSGGTGTFNPSSAKVTWHISDPTNKGLYVSDSTGTWWRMIPTPSPETGTSWSPKAQIAGGFSCVQSVETSPGTHDLLIGPATSGPILKRDSSVFTDNGSAYSSYFILGSIVLAQPGQRAIVSFITTDAMAVGTEPTLAVQLDEIAPVGAGLFESLTQYFPDPTELNASTSVYAQRFYLSQTQQPAWCRHLQIQVNFGTDTVKNELLSLTIFGGFEQED